MNQTMLKPSDRSHAGWTEFQVNEKVWQVFTLDGDKYVKADFSGNFINPVTGKVVLISDIFKKIRNVTDSEGFILAKRKKPGSPLLATVSKSKRRLRMPIS